MSFPGSPALKPMQSLPAKDYKVGDTVYHKAFGRGKILEVDSRHGDAMVIVSFESNGTKKMMANAPMLEKVIDK